MNVDYLINLWGFFRVFDWISAGSFLGFVRFIGFVSRRVLCWFWEVVSFLLWFFVFINWAGRILFGVRSFSCFAVGKVQKIDWLYFSSPSWAVRVPWRAVCSHQLGCGFSVIRTRVGIRFRRDAIAWSRFGRRAELSTILSTSAPRGSGWFSCYFRGWMRDWARCWSWTRWSKVSEVTFL